MSHYLVITTCPDAAVAESLAETLVRERLAACVNILPGATSVYEWQDELVKEQEWVLFIKTRQDAWQRLQARVREQHPYELPEIIAVSIEAGLSDYLSWIDQMLDNKK